MDTCPPVPLTAVDGLIDMKILSLKPGTILSFGVFNIVVILVLYACCNGNRPHDPAPGSTDSRVDTARMHLKSRFPDSKYNISCINRDIRGWVFFSITRRDDGSRTDFSPHHTYAVVRDNGTIVGNSRREKLLELGKIFKTMNLISDYKKYKAKTIADIALCVTGRETIIDEHAAQHLSAMKGTKISPPEIKKSGAGVRISFFTVYYGMAVGNPDKYMIDVSPDYSVNITITSTARNVHPR